MCGAARLHAACDGATRQYDAPLCKRQIGGVKHLVPHGLGGDERKCVCAVLGDFNTNMKANYDYNANRDFLKDVSFNGDLVESSSADDMRVSYEVTHNFGDKNTNVKLTANTQGTTLGAEYDQSDGLKEVSAERDVKLYKSLAS